MYRTATVKLMTQKDGCNPAEQAGAESLPWQKLMAGCGLDLHGRLSLPIDIAALQADFAVLDSVLGDDGRSFMAEDDGWSAINLITRGEVDNTPGIPAPALEYMPSVARLIDGAGWTVVECNLLRLPPRSVLPWHFEALAPYLPGCRVLVPIHAPAGAVTLIGDGAAAYPEGSAWAGDFNFPHQVENHSDHQRIVLLLDLVTTPEILRRLPGTMTEARAQRTALAQQACTLLLAWRAAN